MYVDPWWKNRRVSRGTVGAGLALWGVAMLHSYLRLNLWILDLVIVPIAWICFALGFVLVITGFARGGAAGLVGLLVVPVMVGVTAVIGAWWWIAPQTWFSLHRPLYEQARSVDISDDYYASLPVHLRFLTEGGTVSKRGTDGARFFPQWTGIPDDAGGYWYVPSGSPDGFDMYGMACRGPVPLGGGWWMCGMRD
ncbi:hypothetical protein AXK56_14105 [Tsukamurella pulmonis]|uniref:Uncharacterized protein n=1 Tax=Tsukamurella pulmonis TaxID=47312 RepID=A0A1H1FKU3_9ACTN|nr:hypothetical protein [Tsukamurella pulmonis]KXO87564.1 hypothetical protein AXK56_14105 [Tsukamurella pulmonis]SDR01504.1 hypothetical protein SAMN04489765_2771 [Tsukamurella pulmonis]SUP19260.1 Uncharacterised protein [Tsukamurella pulmonis]